MFACFLFALILNIIYRYIFAILFDIYIYTVSYIFRFLVKYYSYFNRRNKKIHQPINAKLPEIIFRYDIV